MFERETRETKLREREIINGRITSRISFGAAPGKLINDNRKLIKGRVSSEIYETNQTGVSVII